MQLFMDMVFAIIIIFFCYRYILSLLKMKKGILFPATVEEMKAIRKYPQKSLDFPADPKRKTGIIIYFAVLLFIIALFIYGKITESVDWLLYPLLLLPLINGENVLNLFAIQKEGILDRGRFVRWSRMRNYRFVSIDSNHKFYGHTDEVNGGYELIINTKGFPISCIVTTNEMKERLDLFLNKHIQQS